MDAIAPVLVSDLECALHELDARVLMHLADMIEARCAVETAITVREVRALHAFLRSFLGMNALKCSEPECRHSWLAGLRERDCTQAEFLAHFKNVVRLLRKYATNPLHESS